MGGTLVTGANGFIGSAVCRAALAEGGPVHGLVRAGSLVAPIPGVRYSTVEWERADELAGILREAAPARIMHCAGANMRSVTDTVSLYEANVRLSWQLLSAMADAVPGVPAVVLSSAAVYGPVPPVPTTEDAELAPASHYAWSQSVSEHTALAFVDAGLDVRIARPFNLLGENEPHGSIVSDVVDQIEAGGMAVRIRETTSVRDFVDVRDAAVALLVIAEYGRAGEAYNVCTGRGTTVGELVHMILEVWESSAAIEVADPEAAGTVSIGSTDKIASLGFAPSSSLRTALERLHDARTGDVA